MRNTYPLIAALFLLSATACRKDAKLPAAAQTNPTSDQLVSLKWSSPNWGFYEDFQYDATTHLVTYFQGAYNNYLPLIPDGRDSVLEYVSYDQGRASGYGNSAGNIGADTFHYNSNGLLDTVLFSYGWSVPSWQANKYNTAGELTDIFQYDGYLNVVVNHYVFTYDNAGDVIQEVDSALAPYPLSVQTVRYSNYDNKVNFILSVNGLPYTFLLSFGLPYTFSPHNFGTATINDTTVINCSYQYNTQGLPTQIAYDGDTAVLTYQQYK
jgi:hypothetical protein